MALGRRIVSRLRSEFIRNVATYASGVTVAQVVPIALTPILVRVYELEAFGIWGVFSAITAISGIAATGRYEHAILLPPTDRGAAAVTGLALAIVYACCLTVLALAATAVLGFSDALSLAPHWQLLAVAAPIAVAFSASNAVLSRWLARHKRFGVMSRALMIQAVCNSVLALALSFVPAFALTGLSLSLTISLGFNMTYLAVPAIAYLKSAGWPSRSLMLAQAVRYKRFPTYSLLAGLLSSLAAQMPLLAAPSLFGLEMTGQLAMAIRILMLPARFIGRAVSEVFRQRASFDARRPGGCRDIFVKTALTMTAASFAIATPTLLFGPALFAFVLGEPWRLAGEISQILVVMVSLSFIASPVTNWSHGDTKVRKALVDLAVAVPDDDASESLVRSPLACGYRAGAVVEQEHTGRLATVRLLPPDAISGGRSSTSCSRRAGSSPRSCGTRR